MLRRAGYAAEQAGALLSAAGIGALLSPPTLGAAAFLIAEFLRISYLQVLVMATVPTILYYLSIVVMIEAERPTVTGSDQATEGETRVPRRMSSLPLYHFTSLVAIAGFMIAGMSAFRAVFWATVLAIALSFLRRETALTPRRIVAALRSGGQDVLGVAATTAVAGIVVGVVTLTGLGLKIAGLIVSLAGGTLVLTVIYSAIAVWLLGLAVPVTASYIIAAVMVAPALVKSGVPDFAAHMFIFYYAVLSEVSPPTALSPFAAAALTGGNPFKTMILTWKYTLPAFIVPFVFTLTPEGPAVLMRGSAGQIAIVTSLAAVGTAAIAAAFGGRLRAPLGGLERLVFGGAGLVMLFAGSPANGIAAATAVLVLILHCQRHRLRKGLSA
jgi:TRAP transporter 4TM/12TM fusion protein